MSGPVAKVSIDQVEPGLPVQGADTKSRPFQPQYPCEPQ